MQSISGGDFLNFYVMSTLSKAGARCGFNMQEAVSRAQINVEVMDSHLSQLSLAALRRLFEVCAAATETAYFPIVLGDTYGFDAIPEVDTFIATCPTLRVGMMALDWMPSIVHPALRLVTSEDAQSFNVSLSVDGDEPAHPGVVEAALTCVVKFARMISPRDDPLREVWFQHAPQVDPRVYGSYFGVPVRFHQSENKLINAIGSLDKPLNGGFPALNAQAQLMVEQRLKKLSEQGTLSARIEQLLAVRGDLLGAKVEEVAVLLDLHPRTLQRRLKDEGEGFAELQARVRHDRARKLLNETDLDIEAISLKLGFEDRRSFTRAFTRWEGMTPVAYRRPQA
ncbi:MAG: AraC family transcriptional regulator [Rubrivivax sp.]|nr:MAG: AraC family transcriptional regulator [Rubrivivax sp.]